MSDLSGGVHSVTVFAEVKYSDVGVSEMVVFTVVLETTPILATPFVVVASAGSVIAVVSVVIFWAVTYLILIFCF